MAFLAAALPAIQAALPAIQAAGAVLSAVSAIQAGSAQARSMRLQAAQAELQGRQNALNYNRQALQVLERQDRLAGTIRARAAAAGVDPFTGSPLTMQQVNALTAGREAQIAQENAQMAIYGGLAQSQSLQSAASMAQRQATTGALVNLATAAASMSNTATPGTQTPAPVEYRIITPSFADVFQPATSFPVR